MNFQFLGISVTLVKNSVSYAKKIAGFLFEKLFCIFVMTFVVFMYYLMFDDK